MMTHALMWESLEIYSRSERRGVKQCSVVML